jgi:hypothetical protein
MWLLSKKRKKRRHEKKKKEINRKRECSLINRRWRFAKEVCP